MDFTYLRPRKVWEALEGIPDRPSLRTVERWCDGTSVAPRWAAQVMAEKLEAQQEAAPPEWARRLALETALSVIGALAPEAEQRAAAALITRLEGIPPPNGDSPHGSGEAISQDEAEPRVRERE